MKNEELVGLRPIGNEELGKPAGNPRRFREMQSTGRFSFPSESAHPAKSPTGVFQSASSTTFRRRLSIDSNCTPKNMVAM